MTYRYEISLDLQVVVIPLHGSYILVPAVHVFAVCINEVNVYHKQSTVVLQVTY